MAGLIDAGRRYKTEAMGGLSDASRMEEQRRGTNEQLKTAKKQGEMTAMGSGAVSGAMVGAKMGAAAGPWGVAIGALAGLVGGYLLS